MKFYAKEGMNYTLNTVEHLEKALIEKGFVEMKTDIPGQMYKAKKDGTWELCPDKAFVFLRRERDKKLKDTDIYMLSDFPVSEEFRERVRIYRDALRALPSMEGAPWDGGGELTPFPNLEGV